MNRKRRNYNHPWQVTPARAIAIQNNLRRKIITRDDLGVVATVAGVDVGFVDAGRVTRAAVALLAFPSLQVRETTVAERRTVFPYVPGLLSFRELPAVLEALDKLATPPDLIICDGQGYAHPRRCGIACHLGVVTGIPTIGVGKTRLLGTHQRVPNRRGAWQPLYDGAECIGAVVRTRVDVKPVYVSVGHRISLPTAIDLVLRCTPRYRLPETTRQAHRLASERGMPRPVSSSRKY